MYPFCETISHFSLLRQKIILLLAFRFGRRASYPATARRPASTSSTGARRSPSRGRPPWPRASEFSSSTISSPPEAHSRWLRIPFHFRLLLHFHFMHFSPNYCTSDICCILCTFQAACDLVVGLKASIAGSFVMIELAGLGGREKVSGLTELKSLFKY